MALRSASRKLSFDVLANSGAQDDDVFFSRSISDRTQNGVTAEHQKPKKKKKKKKGKNTITEEDTVTDRDRGVIDHSSCRGEFSTRNYTYTVVEEMTSAVVEEPERIGSDFTVRTVSVTPSPQLRQRNVSFAAPMNVGIEQEGGFLASSAGSELRQRLNFTVINGGGGSELEGVTSAVTSVAGSEGIREDDNESLKEERENQQQKKERTVEMNVGRNLEKEESLDWKKLIAEDLNYADPVEKSPMKYFLEEMYAGNSLRRTISLGNEKERERVYDTIFRLPWRCELLINVGFFVCLDSFLSLLTVMPTRIMLMAWRFLKTRQFKKPSAAELCDFGCLIILVSGVTLLQQADISLIYHMIRGQGTVKLYVVYNILEIFDKLCQSFGGDVMQTLFNTAEGLANSSPESFQYWLRRFSSDEALAVASSIVHSFVLLAQGVTLSTCIVAHNNALFALLVSNNFAEIKSNVFKRFSRDNIHSLVYFDSVERFHISAFLLFVLAQNICEAEGPWFENFLYNALVVYICEMMIDIIKHSFVAKFNDIKPIAFSEFLEDLCKQNLKIQTENGKRSLTFVPLAPACVVIRVLRPVYAAHLPLGPLPWRLFWIFLLFVMTFGMLSILKMLIGMGLQKHARWYIKRCQRRKLHTD